MCIRDRDKPFAGQTLTISTFSFNAELLQKNIYDPFEEATGATLVVDTGRNPERVTKIIESPDDYDVVVIGDMFVDQLRKAGVLDTFDSSKLSNIEGIYENARAPMGEGYGPAYTFNRLGIVYDSAFCDVAVSYTHLRHPCGIEAVFRAVDGHERPFAAGLHQTITAAVCLIRKKDGLRKRQRLQLLFDKAAKHTLQTDRGYEGGRRARPSQNIGDVVSAAANGEPLTFRMQVFLGMGKMIDADNDVHTG